MHEADIEDERYDAPEAPGLDAIIRGMGRKLVDDACLRLRRRSTTGSSRRSAPGRPDFCAFRANLTTSSRARYVEGTRPIASGQPRLHVAARGDGPGGPIVPPHAPDSARPRRRRRIVLAVVAPVAADAPQVVGERHVEVVRDIPGFIDCGDYLIDYHVEVFRTITEFYDADGNLVRAHFDIHYKGTFTNAETGLVARDDGSRMFIDDYVAKTWTLVRGPHHVTVPGYGIVFGETGRGRDGRNGRRPRRARTTTSTSSCRLHGAAPQCATRCGDQQRDSFGGGDLRGSVQVPQPSVAGRATGQGAEGLMDRTVESVVADLAVGTGEVELVHAPRPAMRTPSTSSLPAGSPPPTRLHRRYEADARDATQETYFQVARDLPRLREPEKFDAWAGRILHNRCLSLLRRRRNSEVREIRSRGGRGGLLERSKPARRSARGIRRHPPRVRAVTSEQRVLLASTTSTDEAWPSSPRSPGRRPAPSSGGSTTRGRRSSERWRASDERATAVTAHGPRHSREPR